MPWVPKSPESLSSAVTAIISNPTGAASETEIEKVIKMDWGSARSDTGSQYYV